MAPSPADFPELQGAFAAWGQRDMPAMVHQCLESMGIGAPAKPRDDGLGWLFFNDSAAVFVLFNRKSEELAVESPLVRVPQGKETQLFRALLELNEESLGMSRFGLRGGQVLLRFSDRAENVAPPKLVAAIKEVALAANHFDDLLSFRFEAPLCGPELRRAKEPWSAFAPPRRLDIGARAPARPFELEGLADQVLDLSRRSFEALSDPPAVAAASPYHEPAAAREFSDDELELAREPSNRQPGPTQALFALFDQARKLAARLKGDGLATLLCLRAAVHKARALFPPEAQPPVSFLMACLGVWAESLPEPTAPLPQGGVPERPSASELLVAYGRLLDAPDEVSGHFEGAFALEPFSNPNQARAHVRKFMALAVRTPRDDELRVLLLEGALCEMVMRCATSEELQQRLAAELFSDAPPSPTRIQALQTLLTRTWA